MSGSTSSDRIWSWGRGALRRRLVACLPATGWSAEFLDEMDSALGQRAVRGTGPGLTLWYLTQLISPATVAFVRASRVRARKERTSAGSSRLGAGLVLDLRHAGRSVRRDPWVAALVVATLALGMGSVSAMVGLGQRLFLGGPPHVQSPEELQRVVLEFDDPGGRRASPWIPFNTATAIRDSVDAFEGAAIYRRSDELADFGGRVRPVVMGETDDRYFDVLGVQPAAGRFFAARESDAMVVSQAMADDEFGGAVAALGQFIQVGQVAGTIVGVAPQGFAGPDLDRIDVWRPIAVDEASGRNWWMIARLADGAARTSATAEAQAVHEAVDPGQFFQWALDGDVAMVSVREDPTGARTAETSIAILLLGIVFLVLLISWVNVLNLLFARVTRREGEVFVRLALGIGRWRLARLMFAESLLLCGLGGLASLAVAHGQGVLVRTVLLPGVAWGSETLNRELISITFVVALTSAALLGLLPARRAMSADLSRGLGESRHTAGGRRARLQKLLVTGQVVLSAAMLLCAGLFVKSFWTMRVTDLGIDAEAVHVVNLRSLDYTLGGGAGGEDAFYQRAARALRDEGPQNRRIALSIGLPFVTGFGMSVHVDGLDEIPDLPGGGPFISLVSGGFFDTVGTEIVAGRPIESGDVATQAQVAVIGESTARALWPRGDAIGQCARIGAVDDPCFRVVGIAEDVHQRGYREPPSLMFYLPLGSTDRFIGNTLIVRSVAGSPVTEAALAAEISRAVPEVHFVEVRRLSSFLEAEIRPWKLGAVMLSMAAGLAVVMSLAGVFGVLSYVVAQRRREIGVRMALGASTGRIQASVLRTGALSGALGVAIGFAAVALGSRWLAPLLFETSVTDPAVMITVGAGLIGASLLACLLPAVQASRVDPATSLRADN